MSVGLDAGLRQRVIDELTWEPAIDSAHLGVAADDHVVTLTGTVATYHEKIAAERAAERVAGVHAVANDIDVVYPGVHPLTDTDIASSALASLHRLTTLPKHVVDVSVSRRVVTIRGAVEWNFQRQAAEAVVRDLDGVVDVVNLVTVRPRAPRKLVKQSIERALQRNALLGARTIEVETRGGTIFLSGSVASAQERREAERSAWAAPGVRDVVNRLTVHA